ncbi:hypothetical protein EVAR_91479_1 [Eumeta japonica]|uniref:Uncharacterized protein n=1 Tax=Eumeta variegata TaxID=151549 RepID=A0A4C1VA47_EUMVA|nr:hypothetical protein EVAR_91479_1 [Eumeta japonica]
MMAELWALIVRVNHLQERIERPLPDQPVRTIRKTIGSNGGERDRPALAHIDILHAHRADITNLRSFRLGGRTTERESSGTQDAHAKFPYEAYSGKTSVIKMMIMIFTASETRTVFSGSNKAKPTSQDSRILKGRRQFDKHDVGCDLMDFDYLYG